MATPGHLQLNADGYSVQFERYFPFDIKTVWDAITDPDKMAVWFLEVEMDFKPGGKMTMRFPDEHRTETYGRIQRIEPQRLFEFVWLNDDGPDELATWQLFPEGPSNTKLMLTYSRLAEKYAINVPTGWHVMLDHLAEVIAGRTEPYPPQNGPSPEEKHVGALYAALWHKQFPVFELSGHYGTFIRKDHLFDIHFERVLQHPVKRVWEAITEPELLARWFGGEAEMDLRPGGKVRITLLMTTVEGEIIALEPQHLLEYTWGDKNTVRWELFEEGENVTRLVFTETAVDPAHFPDAAPGWHGYLDRLAYVTDGKKVPAFPLEAWPEISKEATAKYRGMLEGK